MDKDEFVKLAPNYYVAAILLEMDVFDEHLSEEECRTRYTIEDPDRDEVCYLQKDLLLRAAFKTLVDAGVLVYYPDAFGPTLYKKADTGYIETYARELRASHAGPYYKCQQARDPRAWIVEALANVNRMFNELNITADDLDSPEKEWEPIQLDRTSETLKEAIDAVDVTIKEVEQSNGYANEHQEERNFVLDNLKMLSERLRNATTISVMYVKTHGINVLKKVSDRFVGTTIGEGAKRAQTALWNWIEEAIKAIF